MIKFHLRNVRKISIGGIPHMNPWIVFAIVLVIAIIILAVLYFYGNKMQKKQETQREQMEANAQNVTMLVIDKKKMPIKDANLPKVVIDNTPKYLRRSKLPIVKAKVGPKVMTLICDEEVFDQVPIKAEIKARVSGLYIIGVRNFRNAPLPPVEKKGFFAKMRSKTNSLSKELSEEKKKEEQKKANKKK